MKLGLGLGFNRGGVGVTPPIQYLHNGFTSPDSLTTGPLWVRDYLDTLVSAGADAPAIPGMRLAYDTYSGATLSEELITNGGFDTDTGWIKGTGWTIEGGKAVATDAADNLTQVSTLDPGYVYIVTYTISDYVTGGVRTFLGNSLLTDKVVTFNKANGTFSELIYKTLTGTALYLAVDSGGTTLKVDNLSVKRVSPIFSPNALPITTWGASLTDGIGQFSYPERLQQLLPQAQVVNEGVSGNSSSTILTRFLAKPTSWEHVTVIMPTRNGGNSYTQIKSDIASMVAELTTDNYVVLSEIGADYEPIGDVNRTALDTFNAELSAIYGDKYVDVWTPLIEAYDPDNAQDVADYADQITPSSLRVDAIHLNSAGYAIMAQTIYDAITSLGYTLSTALYPSQQVRTRQGTVTQYTGDYKGMMGMPARTNLFTAPGAPVTQGITTTVQQYAVSVYGTGSVTLSGSAVGTVNAGEELVVTAEAGTLTVTVTGSPDHVQVEAGAFVTPPIGYGETAATTHTRAATVAEFTSAGRLREQNCAVWGRVIPGAGGQNEVALVSTYVDGSSYIDVRMISTNFIVLRKVISEVTKQALSSYTHSKDTPFEYQAAWTDQGMIIRVKEDGSAWSAWATTANADPAPIADTFQIGARNGMNQFAGTYPFTATAFLPTKATLADYQEWIETNEQWNVLGGEA